MWEDLVVALAGLGFALATALFVIELPGVLQPLADRRVAHPLRLTLPLTPGGLRAGRPHRRRPDPHHPAA